jgi:hypothetical protein
MQELEEVSLKKETAIGVRKYGTNSLGVLFRLGHPSLAHSHYDKS